jgi:nucleotide-binding universal stress UspA family protein
MQEIILHCLEVDADRRYNTAAQIAFDLTHPGQVPLTERAGRLKRAGLPTVLRRWWQSLWLEPAVCAVPSSHLAQAPQILVALDTGYAQDALLQAMQIAVRRVVAAEPHCRVMCVTVLEPDLSTEQDDGEELANSQYTQRLVALRHWAAPLQLPADRLRFHVLEGAHAAAALLDYARQNQVDHIVLGARGSSALRRVLGSVSTRVVAEAPCTVTVVRPPRSLV